MDKHKTKIRSISVQNFTAFRDMNAGFCDGVNIIIGENGTGKTHLLKLLNIFGQVAHSDVKNWVVQYTIAVMVAFVNCAKNSLTHPSIAINGTLLFDASLHENASQRLNYEIPLWKDAIKYSVFIPAKEMLSLSDTERLKERYGSNFFIDTTLTDIIKLASYIAPEKPPLFARSIASKLEEIIGGTVFVNPNDKQFWVKKNEGSPIPFLFEAEGYRKLGLLWQLIMNECIHEQTILLWDEPEANLNPSIIPHIVEILLELSRLGVQVFVATHDYVLAKYFEVRAKENDSVMFHSLYKTDDGVKCESYGNFRDLKNNPIISPLGKLMDEVINGNLGD